MSDIEVDQEINQTTFEEYLQSCDERKTKDLTPEKDQFSSDSEDSDFIDLNNHQLKNEVFLPKTKEQKQKQNEEIVISSCSSNSFLPTYNYQNERLLPTEETNNVTKTQENHYFIDASSLLDESEVTTYTSITLRALEKPSNSKITNKLRADSVESQEFTTEFEKEIKITNLEFTKSNEPSTSYLDNFREISTETQASTSHNFNENDLPSSSSDRSYISLNSQLLDKNDSRKEDFQQETKDFSSERELIPKTTWAEKNHTSLDSHFLNTQILGPMAPSTSLDSYMSLDSHILNKNFEQKFVPPTPKVSLEKKPNFVRSGTFELDSDIRQNEKRQGTLIFQNSIHQYSGHSLEPETILPSTPFNSIIHVNQTLQLTNKEGPLNGVFPLENPAAIPIPKSDTIDSLASLCEAQIKREDSVPIISGGILPSDCEIEVKSKENEVMLSSSSKSEVKTAWVVDMSTPPPQKKVFNPPEKEEEKKKSSLGFFIDLTDVKNGTSHEETAKPKPENDIKKNIFSMSIEFQAPKKGMPSRLSQSLSTKKQNGDNNVVKSEVKSDKKIIKKEINGDTQNGTKTDKIQFRHKRSNSNSMNRHSWNGQHEDFGTMNHQRTFSLSEKMSEHTSLTIDFKNDVIHLEQVETCENYVENDHPKPKVNGFDSSLENGNHVTKNKGKRNGKRDANKSPTNDLMSHLYNAKDVTRHPNDVIGLNDVIAHPSDVTRDPNDVTRLPNDVRGPNDVTKHPNDVTRQPNDVRGPNDVRRQPNDVTRQPNDVRGPNDVRRQPNDVTRHPNDVTSHLNDFGSNGNGKKSHECILNATQSDEKQNGAPQIQVQSVSSYENGPNESKSTKNQTVIIINHDDIIVNQFEEETPKEKLSEGFVSLSDLDKPIPKVITEEPTYTRMTRSIPETSWIENKLLMSRSIGCRPSTKMLSNMSTSTPSFCFNGNRISSDSDVFSELSDFSSIQSSTALEISTEDTSQSLSTHHHSNKLGTDLLRMFLEEISPDLTITVAGRRLRAHKCILSSRCQYFAAMLSGGHVESSGNVISLDGFTFQAVYFAMCHIYSGAADIPESIDLVELATLADMLGLEGLKEVVATTLKLKYCHMFHKPCSVCVVGILETLQLAFTYSLDDLYRKCLKWITRYFVRVWATRAFASLTRELHEKCYQQHIVHMSGDSVLETMLCVDKLLATLPNVRWAEIVTELAERLKDDCELYLMEHFASVLGSASFLSLGKELNWNISKLEGAFLLAAENLSPEQACRSYAKINKLQAFLQVGDESWSMNFTDLVNNLYTRVESSVVRQAVRICHTNSWAKLDPYLRTRVQELACIPLEIPEKPQKTKHQPRSTSGSRNLDLRQIRLAMQQHNKRATSTESRVKKVQEKKVVKVVQEPQPPRPRTWPAQTLKTKIISSSESSRNSSPAMKNTSTKSETKTQKVAEKAPNLTKTTPKSTQSKAKVNDKKVAAKSKVMSTTNPPVKQHLTNSQKTIKLTATTKISSNKVQKTNANKPPLVTKNSTTSSNVSKSGSNSSNQQSPSLKNRNKQNLSSSNSTPSQTKSDSNPYSGSPSLRRSLLLAAKSPQVPPKPMSPATNKRLARVQASNSLTSPTKASLAKSVNNQKTNAKNTKTKDSKIVKENNKPLDKIENTSTDVNNKKSDKPTVERSGTFLKDEPTVLNKA